MNEATSAEGTVRAIQHGLTSPERTREMSVVTVDREVGGRTLSIPDSMGTLDDRHMGPITRTERCLTCHGTEETCPGHMGCIELACAVIPDMFMSHVIRAMKVVCQTPNCNATFPYVRYEGTLDGGERGEGGDDGDGGDGGGGGEVEVSTRKTWCPSCNARLPTIMRSMSKTHVLVVYKHSKVKNEGKKEKKEKKGGNEQYTITVTHSPDEVAAFLESKPDWVWESVGYKTKWAHPAWLVRKNVSVIPNNARPYSVHNGNTYADSLTTLYSAVIRMNEIAKRARSDPATPEFVLQNNYEDLVNATRAVWDSRKGGVVSKRSVGMVTKLSSAAAVSTVSTGKERRRVKPNRKRRRKPKNGALDEESEEVEVGEEEEEEEEAKEVDDDDDDDDESEDSFHERRRDDDDNDDSDQSNDSDKRNDSTDDEEDEVVEDEEEEETQRGRRRRGAKKKEKGSRRPSSSSSSPLRNEVHVTYTMLNSRGTGIEGVLDMAGVTTSATHVIHREPVVPNGSNGSIGPTTSASSTKRNGKESTTNDGKPTTSSLVRKPTAPPQIATARAFVQRMGKGNGEDAERGRVRQNLMGGRVNYAARAVATADSTLRLNQIRVPLAIANVLTKPIRVTDFNLETCREMVRDARMGKIVKFQDGREGSINLKTIDRAEEEAAMRMGGVVATTRRMKKTTVSPGRRSAAERLKPGDVVERSLQPGDIVIMNRQPSLHKASIMAGEATIAPVHTISFNMSVCKSLNADFDGDEINLHVPQSLPAEIEAKTLMPIDENIVDPKNNRPAMGLVYDAVVGVYSMTLPSTFLNYETMMQLRNRCFNTGGGMEEDDEEDVNRWRLPHPAIFMPGENPGDAWRVKWTGKQAFSMILPRDFTYGGSYRPFPKEERMGEKTLEKFGFVDWDEKEDGKEDGKEFNKEHDQACLVLRGELLCGILSSATMGNVTNNLIHAVYTRFGSKAASNFISNSQFLVYEWSESQGFSMGLNDCILSRDDEDKMCEFRKTIRRQRVNASDAEIAELRGRMKIDHFATSNNNSTVEGWGRRTSRYLNKRTNGLLRMVLAGSKGSITNVSQMCEVLGQQTTGGGTCIPPNPSSYASKGPRVLPHFRPWEWTPISRGYVETNYFRGLGPAHFFKHSKAGNVGVTDTATKTGRSGYSARQLVKSLENLSQSGDGTVRRNNSTIIQFQYGDDGFKGESFVPMSASFFTNRVKADEEAEKNITEIDDYENAVRLARAFVRETMDFVKKESGKMDFTHFLLPVSFIDLEIEIDTKRDDDDDEGESLLSVGDDSLFIRNIVAMTIHDVWKLQGLSIPETKTREEFGNLAMTSSSTREFSNAVKSRIHYGEGNALLICLLLSCYTPRGLIDVKRWTRRNVERFMERFVVRFERARVETSESVGAIAAQSISEPATQMTLSSFHYVSNPLMQLTAGLTRLEELLRYKDDSTPVVRIVARTEDIAKTIRAETSLRELFSHPSDLDKASEDVKEDWERRYEAVFFSTMVDTDTENDWVYRVAFSPEKLFESDRSLTSLRETMYREFRALGMFHSESISDEYVPHSCFFSQLPRNYEMPIVKFRFRNTNFHAAQRAIAHVESMAIDGIVGTSAIERKGTEVSIKWKTNEAFLDSPRVAMQTLWNLCSDEEIDHARTTTNSVRAAFETLGIEAARTVLLRELRAVVSSTSYINDRHLKLLVDTMTHTGTIRNVTRGGMHVDNESPLGKASYESTIASFVEGSLNGVFDPMRDTSARIAVGTQIAVGSAANFSLILDVETLAKHVKERVKPTPTTKKSRPIPTLASSTTTGTMNALSSFLYTGPTTTTTTTKKEEKENDDDDDDGPVWYGSDDEKGDSPPHSPTYSPTYSPTSPPSSPPIPEYSPTDEFYGNTPSIPSLSPPPPPPPPPPINALKAAADAQRLRNIQKMRGIMKGFS